LSQLIKDDGLSRQIEMIEVCVNHAIIVASSKRTTKWAYLCDIFLTVEACTIVSVCYNAALDKKFNTHFCLTSTEIFCQSKRAMTALVNCDCVMIDW